jgi:hypothetical protein
MACLRRIYLCCVSLLLASTNVGCEDSCVSDGYRFDASIPEAERRAITAAASEVNAFVGYQAIRIDDSSMCVISDRQIGMHPDGTGLVSGRRKRDLGGWTSTTSTRTSGSCPVELATQSLGTCAWYRLWPSTNSCTRWASTTSMTTSSRSCVAIRNTTHAWARSTAESASPLAYADDLFEIYERPPE